MSGDKHHRRRLIRRHLADLHTKLEAALPWHLDIEKNEIETILLQQALGCEWIVQTFGGKVSLSECGTNRITSSEERTLKQELAFGGPA